MIIARTDSHGLAEHSTLPLIAEQEMALTEPRYDDKQMWAWVSGAATQPAEDRMEADRLSVARQMAGAFA